MNLTSITNSELAVLALNRLNLIKDFPCKQNVVEYIQSCINELKQILNEYETRVTA